MCSSFQASTLTLHLSDTWQLNQVVKSSSIPVSIPCAMALALWQKSSALCFVRRLIMSRYVSVARQVCVLSSNLVNSIYTVPQILKQVLGMPTRRFLRLFAMTVAWKSLVKHTSNAPFSTLQLLVSVVCAVTHSLRLFHLYWAMFSVMPTWIRPLRIMPKRLRRLPSLSHSRTCVTTSRPSVLLSYLHIAATVHLQQVLVN